MKRLLMLALLLAPLGAQAADPTTTAYGIVSQTAGAGTYSASSLTLKTSTGMLYDVYAMSSAAAYLAVVNLNAAPASGSSLAATLVDCIQLPVNTQTGFDYNLIPEPFVAGITVLVTTVPGCGTYTPSATAFIHGRVK